MQKRCTRWRYHRHLQPGRDYNNTYAKHITQVTTIWNGTQALIYRLGPSGRPRLKKHWNWVVIILNNESVLDAEQNWYIVLNKRLMGVIIKRKRDVYTMRMISEWFVSLKIIIDYFEFILRLNQNDLSV